MTVMLQISGRVILFHLLITNGENERSSGSLIVAITKTHFCLGLQKEADSQNQGKNYFHWADSVI